MAQLSEEPLSICDAIMDACPVPSSCIVMSCVITTGANLSSTVTIAVLVAILPCISVTVKVTVTGVPTLEQPKLVMSNVLVAMPQLSVEPLSTWSVVIKMCPVASN